MEEAKKVINTYKIPNRKKTYKRKKKQYHYTEMTREDIEMFQEKTLDSANKNKKNTCDSHIDGA